MELLHYLQMFATILVILGTLSGMIYWLIKSKIMKDIETEFARKESCDNCQAMVNEKFHRIDNDLGKLETGTQKSIDKLFQVVDEIRNMLIEYIKKG